LVEEDRLLVCIFRTQKGNNSFQIYILNITNQINQHNQKDDQPFHWGLKGKKREAIPYQKATPIKQVAVWLVFFLN